MKLRCPHCGHAASLLNFASEQAARQTVLLVADLPKPLGKPVLQYIGLFRPAQRSLSWDRTLKLLNQLKTDIDRGKIERHSRIWPAPEPAWHNAINAMLLKADTNTLKLPLKNHGYLYEIISSQQSSVEAKDEQRLENNRMAQRTRPKAPTLPILTDVDKQAGESSMNQIFEHLKIKKKSKKGTQ